ncbi:MAG: hypothetical protein HXP18_00930 [Veillonella sp.]|nr:hypothetical protein [Veillonella sp.]
MLQSKYFTEEGLKLLLNDLYEGGARYVYRPTGYALIYLSKYKPIIEDDGEIKHTLLDSPHLPVHTTNLLNDVFENTNCIDLAKALHKVDWSKVPVDTKVCAYKDGMMKLRHFAYCKEDKVYTWKGGGTSWSTPYAYGEWEDVGLAEEVEYA